MEDKLQESTQLGVLYRYEEDPSTNQAYTRIALRIFPITKTTPKGVWVDTYGIPRFVLSGAHKRFACTTKKEAIHSFIARKKRQVRILKSQCEIARSALSIAKKMREYIE